MSIPRERLVGFATNLKNELFRLGPHMNKPVPLDPQAVILSTIEAVAREAAEAERTRNQPPVQATQGCVCPVGAEAVCKAPLCPRIEWRIT